MFDFVLLWKFECWSPHRNRKQDKRGKRQQKRDPTGGGGATPLYFTLLYFCFQNRKNGTTQEDEQHHPKERRREHSPTRKGIEGQQPPPESKRGEAAPTFRRERKGSTNPKEKPSFGRWCDFPSQRSPSSFGGAAFLCLLWVARPFSFFSSEMKPNPPNTDSSKK